MGISAHKLRFNMNENLNLVEILKYVPRGTMLWSPIYGDCEFIEIRYNDEYPIICLVQHRDGS